MPVSVVCETAASVNAALRESLCSSGSSSAAAKAKQSSHQDDKVKCTANIADDIELLHGKLVASAKRVLFSKIDYEEVSNYGQSVLERFKSKYIVMKPCGNNIRVENGRSSPKTCSNNYANGDRATDANGNNTPIANGVNAVNKQKNNPNELPAPKRILFPRENIRPGWKATGRKWEIGVGMMNVGNTCYLNSTLQALFHVPSMANWLISDSVHMERCESTDAGCIICAMTKTLQESQKNQSAIRPYYVYSKLKSICKHLVMGRQEDAHEFLRYLVEAMEKSYLSRFRNYKELDQYSKETTPLNQILGGYLKSAVRCLACNHVSVTYQHFQDLLLDIRKADTVDEALEVYFSRERLEDMGYKCEACKKKVSATKQFSLERAPIALCIQLKRFSMLGTKLTKQITIKPRLDLTKFTSRRNPGEQLTYRLVSMVTHLGASQHCGHYTAIGLTESGVYYNYDDSYVRPISMQNVCNTNAYIIFYEMDTQPLRNVSSTQVSGTLPATVLSAGNEKDSQSIKINGHALGGIQHVIGPQLPPGLNINTSSNEAFSLLPNVASKLISIRNPASLASGSNTPLSGASSKIVINFENNSSSISTSTVKTSAATSSITSASATSTSSSSIFDALKNSSNDTTINNLHGLHLLGAGTFQDSANLNYTLGVSTSRILVSNDKKCNESSSDDDNKNEIVSSSTSSQAHTATQATLPSMPKLGIESTSNLTNGSAKKLPALIKSLVPYGSETDDETDACVITTAASAAVTSEQQNRILPNPLKRRQSSSSWSSNSASDNADNENDIKPSNNVKIKKAVSSTTADTVHNQKSSPKTSDYATKTSSDAIDEIFHNIKHSNSINSNSSFMLLKKKSKSHQFTVTSTTSTAGSLSSGSEDDEGNASKSSSAKSSFKKSHLTPPSPPVVKTNSGIWQVTSLHPVIECISPIKAAPSSTTVEPVIPKNPKNPFATKPQMPTDNAAKRLKKEMSNKLINGSFYQRNNTSNETAVSELLKQSHRGYGSQILSWNGQQSEINKEIMSEAREQRQRDWEDEEGNEMDRGRQKKVKESKDPYSLTRNPSYNPFQEEENQRRWKRYHVGNGGSSYRHNIQRKFKFQRFQHKFSKKIMFGVSSTVNANRRNDS